VPRLLDANVFITAKNTYYGLDLVPAFWSWLEDQARAGELASTDLVYEELKSGNDELAAWVKDRREVVFHVGSSSATVAAHVATLGAWAVSAGYKPHVIEDFMDCADPFLVGVAAELAHTVVTQETPAGSKRKKVKVPDACAHLSVPYEDTFDMMRSLGARFA
jgi:hypothetical protein